MPVIEWGYETHFTGDHIQRLSHNNIKNIFPTFFKEHMKTKWNVSYSEYRQYLRFLGHERIHDKLYDCMSFTWNGLAIKIKRCLRLKELTILCIYMTPIFQGAQDILQNLTEMVSLSIKRLKKKMLRKACEKLAIWGSAQTYQSYRRLQCCVCYVNRWASGFCFQIKPWLDLYMTL